MGSEARRTGHEWAGGRTPKITFYVSCILTGTVGGIARGEPVSGKCRTTEVGKMDEGLSGRVLLWP